MSDGSPYAPPNAVVELRQRNNLKFFIAPVIVPCGLNLILGAMDPKNEMREFAKWGAYCGEYICLLTWFAWGTGPLTNRLATTGWLGILWMLASWLGFALVWPDRYRSYSHEFSQIFTVIPLAFLISSLPLFLMQRRFIFENTLHGTPDAARRTTNSGIALSLITVVIAVGFFYDRWLLSDIGLSFIVAIVLGMVAAVASPLFSIVFLRPSPKLSVLLVAFLVIPLIGAFIAGFFGMPGPGAAGTVFATTEAMLAATVSLGPIVATFWYWRYCGIRIARSYEAAINHHRQ